ncbi:MAG: fibronectin type III domain-containing protein, partial [Actinomycetota bacterium]|nr:fibronectin type III domain-containing protein [Actinomycetota bacterium]
DPHSQHQTASTILLSWVAPTILTGAAVEGYTVYRDAGLGGAIETVVSCGESDALATTCQLTELEAGHDYRFQVTATNSGGEGYRSAEVAQSTAPTTVVSMVRNASTTDSITIEWEDVASAEGADPVTGYKIYDRVVTPLSEVTEAFESAGIAEATLDHFFDYELNEMVEDTLMYDGSGETQSRTTIANLEGGKLYNFVIDALSDAGISNRSVVTSMSTCTPAPTNVTSVAHTTDDITVSWVAPVVASDAAQVERYVLYRNDGTADGALDIEVDCTNWPTLGTTCLVEGLEGGTEYLFQVSTISAAGESFRSTPSFASSTAPAELTVVSSPDQTTSSIDLVWTPPVTSGGAPTTGYIVYRNDGLGGTDFSTVGYDG